MIGSLSNETRQKLINLMYIVFIMLAFIYLPSDFVDSAKYTSLSLSQTGDEYIRKVNEKRSFLDEQLYSNSPLAQDYYNVMEISGAIDTAATLIKNMVSLVYEDVGGLNENDYLVSSKNFLTSNRLLVKEGNAAKLKLLISSIKEKIRAYNLTGITASLDTALPSSLNITGSSGKERPWENFFFSKVPVSVAVTNLYKIRADLLYAKYKLVEYLVSNLGKSQTDRSISILSNNSVAVEVLGSKNFVLGDKVAFRLVMLDSGRGYDNVRAFIKQGDRVIKELKIEKSGLTGFIANQTGKFQLVVKDSTNIYKQDFVVTNLRTAYAEKYKPEVLYMGMDNPIQLQASELNLEDLRLEIDMGEIIPFGGKYYLRFKKEGIAKLKVYATNSDGRFLVTEKEYEVKKLPTPQVTLDGRPGSSISRKLLLVQEKLVAESSEPGLEGVYNIISYEVVKVSNFGKESVVNKGKDFSSDTRKLIRDTKAGDLLVIDNIKIEATDGALKDVAPVVFSIK